MFKHRGRKFYSADEAARIHDISVEWWRAKCRARAVVGAFFEGGAWWIPASEVRSWRRIGHALRKITEINSSIETA